jgi:hypothetical protein
MSIEKESNDNSAEGGTEAAELVPATPTAPKAAGEKNELRIVLQVELRTDISEGGTSGGNASKRITVVNHQIRSIVHIIGGGDVEREGEES